MHQVVSASSVWFRMIVASQGGLQGKSRQD